MKALFIFLFAILCLSCTDDRFEFETYKLEVIQENELFEKTVLVNVLSNDTVYFPCSYIKSLVDYKDVSKYYFYFLHYPNGDYYVFIKVELKSNIK